MATYRENKPSADILMNSMRAIGYSFDAAIADVIDNSISAEASRIDIKFPVKPENCFIVFCDNGNGMDRDELFDAMKYGSQPKGGKRSETDLGRFGLGMKAASLSQCRKLTVVSKRRGRVSSFCWDLDHIEKIGDTWSIIEFNSEEIKTIPFSAYLDSLDHGTIVVWEKFDLIEKDSGNVYQELLTQQESTSKYLSLIFHRYLNNKESNNVLFFINNYQLTGLDPFLEKHKKTNPRREIDLRINDSLGIERVVRVQPYVLPFQRDLTHEDIELLGGIEDYRTKQGYYIYRNDRLIIWGTWFGRPKHELTKYARVKIDIPNTLDDIWGIDIKKESATIPRIIKRQLTKAVDEAMDIAIKHQTYRGRINKIDEDIDYLWNRIEERELLFSYKINRDSRIFDLLKNSIDDVVWNKFNLVLDEIENGIPYQQIYIDKSQNRISEEISDDRLPDIQAKAEMLVNLSMKISGINRVELIKNLFQSEPFNKYPTLLQIMLSEVDRNDYK